jgi:hypothetical protein
MVSEEHARKVAQEAAKSRNVSTKAIETRDGRLIAGTGIYAPGAITAWRDDNWREMLIITPDEVRIEFQGKTYTIHKWGWEPGEYIPR